MVIFVSPILFVCSRSLVCFSCVMVPAHYPINGMSARKKRIWWKQRKTDENNEMCLCVRAQKKNLQNENRAKPKVAVMEFFYCATFNRALIGLRMADVHLLQKLNEGEECPKFQTKRRKTQILADQTGFGPANMQMVQLQFFLQTHHFQFIPINSKNVFVNTSLSRSKQKATATAIHIIRNSLKQYSDLSLRYML